MRDSTHDPSGAQGAQHDVLAAWLAAAAGGDGRAFESFYNATCRQALAIVRRITGDALAEDVLADSYFQAWRTASQFDATRGSALAWLLMIARSRALDRMRRESLRHGGPTGAPAFDPEESTHDAAPAPDALLETVEASTRLHEALRTLSSSERWVLGLAYFRDTSQAEIAAITGMPLGTVKSLMSRAQHKLRGALDHARP